MWENIVTWFSDARERKGLLRAFNYSARNAYTHGASPILLKASITLGRRENKTNYSWLRSGFRIKTLASGYYMEKYEATMIAMIIITNTILVRQLIALGFDTLEVGSEGGKSIYSWPLIKFSLTQ